MWFIFDVFPFLSEGLSHVNVSCSNYALRLRQISEDELLSYSWLSLIALYVEILRDTVAQYMMATTKDKLLIVEFKEKLALSMLRINEIRGP